MTDLVIVSMHEKGFPQADFYADRGEMDPCEFRAVSPSPDAFFTMSKRNTMEDAFANARKHWPTARIVEAESDDDEDSAES